jgi:hypothetical protein
MAAYSCRSRLFDTSEIISCAVIFPVLALVGEAPSRGQQSRCNSSLRIKRIMGALRHRLFILREIPGLPLLQVFQFNENICLLRLDLPIDEHCDEQSVALLLLFSSVLNFGARK